MARNTKYEQLDGLKGAENLGYLIRNLMLDLRQTMETAFRDGGIELSMTQLGTIYNIYIEPGLPGAQLAKRLFITAQSMNDVLKTMESLDLVERRPHPSNQRAFCWYVTASGLAILGRSGDTYRMVMKRMQSQLSPAETEQLMDLLSRCIAGLHDED